MEATIKAAIEKVLQQCNVLDVDFVVEHPGDIGHGDYASNVALVAFKKIMIDHSHDIGVRKVFTGEDGKLTPASVAETIKNKLAGEISDVADITIAGPGFINFHLERSFFTKGIASAVADEAWGSNTTASTERILIEYTSPNLFKPLHVGNLVGNILGESLSRLMELSGATVTRCNYPSDIGLTVAKGVWGLLKTGNDPDDIQALGDAYRVGSEAYENDPEAKAAIDQLNKALYVGSDPVAAELRLRGIATSKARLKELLTILGTTFDFEIHESEVSEPGTAIVREHIGSVFTESDGAVVFEGEKVGLHTRVFLNSLGLPTYEAKDLGNFVLKTVRVPDWTTSLIITGSEQTEYFKVLYAAIRELYPEMAARKLEHIPTGFLTLTTGKMSSRKGNVLTGESLLEEMEAAARERAALTRTDNLDELTEMVAVAALKYQILRHGVGSNIIFDKEKALSFEGDSGPYLQYTYARIVSVLEKAAAVGVVPSTAVAPETPYHLEQLLYRFPEVIAAAYAERAPNKVAVFLIELASAFNSFYAVEKIADAAEPYAAYKAAVAQAVANTLKTGLWALGIKAPEKM